MAILVHNDIKRLWQDSIHEAEDRCAIHLELPLESYLIELLMDYTDKPQIAKTQFALNFLAAKQSSPAVYRQLLQKVGDECLIYAGLYPEQAEKRHVKINYFVDIGRNAYSTVSHFDDDVFSHLASYFVAVMDVLQSIQPNNHLLPLQAYEQWQAVGSQRALKMLNEYTTSTPSPRKFSA